MALAQFIAPLEILPYGDDAAHYYGTQADRFPFWF